MMKGNKSGASENQAKDRALCQPLALVLGTAGPSLRARRNRHLIEGYPSYVFMERWDYKTAGLKRCSEHTHLPMLAHSPPVLTHTRACTPFPMLTHVHTSHMSMPYHA